MSTSSSATAFPEGAAPKAPGQHSTTAFPGGAAPKAPGRPDAPPSAIAGQTVVLRPTTPEHVPVFLEVLGHPEIAKWWGGYDLERVRRELLGPHGFAVELAGEPIGLIIYREEHDPDHRRAAIDLALHPDQHSQGLGCDAIRAMCRYLFEVRGHHRIVIDPPAANERAIRSCGRAGFKPVGVMRRYERSADGTWHDGLLMDLLREEF